MQWGGGPPADVLLLCMKTFQVEAAVKQLVGTPAVGPDTMVITTQVPASSSFPPHTRRMQPAARRDEESGECRERSIPTVPLPPQNGVEAHDKVGAAVGEGQTVASVVRVLSYIAEPGVIQPRARVEPELCIRIRLIDV